MMYSPDPSASSPPARRPGSARDPPPPLHEEGIEGPGIGRWRQMRPITGRKFNDARPTLGRTHHAPDGRRPALLQRPRHHFVCAHHKVFNQIVGAILTSPAMPVTLPSFITACASIRSKAGPLNDSAAPHRASALHPGALIAPEVPPTTPPSAAAPALPLHPRPHSAIGQLRAIADQRPDDTAEETMAPSAPTTISITIAARSSPSTNEVRSVDRFQAAWGRPAPRCRPSWFRMRVIVNRGVQVHLGSHIGNADQDANPLLHTLRRFDLIQVARGVVVDGRPKEIAKVGKAGGNRGRGDGCYLGDDGRRQMRMKPLLCSISSWADAARSKGGFDTQPS